ncbi:MAG: hypothetical protein V1867_01900 [Candidatus Falkowbacteria bacterium]
MMIDMYGRPYEPSFEEKVFGLLFHGGAIAYFWTGIFVQSLKPLAALYAPLFQKINFRKPPL